MSWLIAHLIGDFLFQPKWVKGNSTLVCTLHCLIYTLAVIVFSDFVSQSFIVVFPAIFIPHFIIDRWSLAYVWMPLDYTEDIHLTIVDQTLHLICLAVLRWTLMM